MVEYWKEQDAFYGPSEFGLYNPYEVNEKFVEPMGFNPMKPVVQRNEAPKSVYGSPVVDWMRTDTHGIPNWLIALAGLTGTVVVLHQMAMHISIIPDEEYGDGFPIRLRRY